MGLPACGVIRPSGWASKKKYRHPCREYEIRYIPDEILSPAAATDDADLWRVVQGWLGWLTSTFIEGRDRFHNGDLVLFLKFRINWERYDLAAGSLCPR